MEVRNVVISKEYIEKTKQFSAIDPEEKFTYVPIVYREFEEQLRPVFTLKPVSGEKILKFQDEMSGDVEVSNGHTSVKVKRGSFVISVVRAGLCGWEGFCDHTGKIVEYNAGGFDCLQRKLLEELSEAILSRSALSEEEILGLK